MAVIINYQDWQRIEALLQRQPEEVISQLETTLLRKNAKTTD